MTLINKKQVRKFIKETKNVSVEKDFYDYLDRRLRNALLEAISKLRDRQRLTKYELGF